MSDLDSILNGEEPPVEQPAEVEVETTATTEPEKTTEPEETPKGESASSPDAEIDKRVKGLEAELGRIRAKNRELESSKQEPKPDFWSDPDNAIQALEKGFDQKLLSVKLDMSETAARYRHEDYDAQREVFDSLVADNPGLVQTMMSHPDAAEFVYQTARNHQRMLEIGSLDTLEAQARADERAKVEAEMKAKYEGKIQQVANLPGSLADTRAAGGNDSPAVVDESLDDVVGADASHRR